MFGLGAPELLIIVIVAALLLFGGGKVSEFARSLGRFSGEFQKGKLEIERELQQAREQMQMESGAKKK